MQRCKNSYAMNADTIYSLFRQRVLEQSDAPAVGDGRRSLTYRQLDELVDDVAALFPVAKPRFVGIVADHGVGQIAALLAVLKRGAAYVPMEPSFPKGRMRFVMGECGVDFIITQPAYRDKLSGFAQLVLTPGVPLARTARPVADESKPEGLAYVLYTSGSTGKPKGVAVENRNVCHYVRAFCSEFRPKRGDVMLQYSVCSFDIFVEEVFRTGRGWPI